MNVFPTVEAAHSAVSHNPNKPASATLFDSPDVRLIVFRLMPGQVVPTWECLDGGAYRAGGKRHRGRHGQRPPMRTDLHNG